MNIFKLQNEVWKIAEEKGWHDKDVLFGDFISNCHGELSEAFEVYKEKGESAIGIVEIEHETMKHYSNGVADMSIPIRDKPGGIPIELADVVIRILDFCETVGINLEDMIGIKSEYNKTRSYRHGGKVV